MKNSKKKKKPQLFYTQSELGHQILAFNSKILGESKRSWSIKRHPISLFIYYNYTAMIHISIITFLQYSTFRGTQGSYTWKLDAKKFFRHPPLPPISHHFDTQTFWLQNCMTSNYDANIRVENKPNNHFKTAEGIDTHDIVRHFWNMPV